MITEIRRYQLNDIPILLRHIKEFVSTTSFCDIKFSKDKMEDILTGNVRNITFFCNIALVDGEIAAGLCGGIQEYIFSREVMAVDHLFYTVPNFRNLGIAEQLVTSYVVWAKERRVRQVRMANITGNKIEGFRSFIEKQGFKTVGSVHLMEI